MFCLQINHEGFWGSLFITIYCYGPAPSQLIKTTLNPIYFYFVEVPVLNIVGSLSPFIEDTVTLNGRLAPEKTNWIKLQDAAMVVEEQPGKVCEAFRSANR